MISKELLREVLSFNENWYVYSLYLEDNILNINAKSSANEKASDFIEINIYELAHECKEWATFKNGKNIITERDISGVYSYIIFMIGITIHNEYLDDTTRILANFKADTEPEAIFKACQWILENK